MRELAKERLLLLLSSKDAELEKYFGQEARFQLMDSFRYGRGIFGDGDSMGKPQFIFQMANSARELLRYGPDGKPQDSRIYLLFWLISSPPDQEILQRTLVSVVTELGLRYELIRPLVEYLSVSDSPYNRSIGHILMNELGGRQTVTQFYQRIENLEFEAIQKAIQNRRDFWNRNMIQILRKNLDRGKEKNAALLAALRQREPLADGLYQLSLIWGLSKSKDPSLREAAFIEIKKGACPLEGDNQRRNCFQRIYESLMGSGVLEFWIGTPEQTNVWIEEAMLKLDFTTHEIAQFIKVLATEGIFIQPRFLEYLAWALAKLNGKQEAESFVNDIYQEQKIPQLMGGDVLTLLNKLKSSKKAIDYFEFFDRVPHWARNFQSQVYDYEILKRVFLRLTDLPPPLLSFFYVLCQLSGDQELQSMAVRDLVSKLRSNNAFEYEIDSAQYRLWLHNLNNIYQWSDKKLPVSEFKEMLDKELASRRSSSSKVKKQFAYINGGYSTYTNYTTNEQDLLAFHYNLFDGMSHLINANGTGTPVAGVTPRVRYTSDGYNPTLTPGSGIVADKATNENLLKLVQKMVNASPDEATLVFGGHGSYMGIALWDLDMVSARQLRALYQRFSPETLVRSVYLHCYAGASAVSPYRTLPSQFGNSVRFFDNYYPLNRCALGNSMHDEIGQYYSNVPELKDNRWVNLFGWNANPSLTGLKAFLERDGTLKPTPVLTSDYFVSDLTNILCNERSQTSGKGPTAVSQLSQQQANELNELCDGPDTMKYSEAAEVYAQNQNLSNTLRGKTLVWSDEYIETEYPEVWRESQKSLEKSNLQRRNFVRESIGDASAVPGLSLIEEEALRNNTFRVGSMTDSKYEELISSVIYRSKAAEFFDQKVKEYMNAEAAKFSEFNRANPNPVVGQTRLVFEVERFYDNLAQNQLSLKKNLGLNFFRARRRFVEEILNLPVFHALRDRYQNILRCEKSIIN